MKRYLIGIDPGKTGAIVILDTQSQEIVRYIMPLIGKEIDIHKLVSILKTYKEEAYVAVENVHAIFGAAATATFNFGYNCGLIEGILCSLSIPYLKINPKEWQKESWLGITVQKKTNNRTDTKAMSLLAAKRLYPNVDLLASKWCTNPHEGIVDALLIVHYLKIKHIKKS